MSGWMMVVDQRSARLLSLQRTQGGSLRGEDYKSIRSKWDDQHEHGRPSRLGGRSEASHPHLSSGFSEIEDKVEARRFARDIRVWIDHEVRGLTNGTDLIVFASPRIFGILGDELDDHDWITLLQADFARYTPDQLVKHPAVLEAIRIVSSATRF